VVATVGAMYRPPSFAEDDRDVLVGLARRAGFGHLVVVRDGAPLSTPVPFVVDDAFASVRMHLARPNPVWRSAPCRALVIVAIADAYVSPSWYPSKAEHGKVVPTWNYEVVHAHGELVLHDDPDWVRGQIAELTVVNESSLPAPWSVDDPPPGFVDQLQRGIVGVELVVDRLEGKRKLGQNRDDADRLGAADGMRAAGRRGSADVSEAMRGA
jgi:transcriptional regulator